MFNNNDQDENLCIGSPTPWGAPPPSSKKLNAEI